MNGVVKGKNILITMRTGVDEYTVFACGTDCTFTFNRGKLELTDEAVGVWKKWIPTELTGTIEVSGVIVLYDDGKFTIFDVIEAQWTLGRLDFLATIYDAAGNEAVFTCACIIDVTSLGMPAGDLSSTTISLTIDGEPTITKITDLPPIDDNGHNPDCVILDGSGNPVLDEYGRTIETDCIYSDVTPTPGEGDFSESDFTPDFFI